MSTSATTITADQVRIVGDLELSDAAIDALANWLLDQAVREVSDEQNGGAPR